MVNAHGYFQAHIYLLPLRAAKIRHFHVNFQTKLLFFFHHLSKRNYWKKTYNRFICRFPQLLFFFHHLSKRNY